MTSFHGAEYRIQFSKIGIASLKHRDLFAQDKMVSSFRARINESEEFVEDGKRYFKCNITADIGYDLFVIFEVNDPRRIITLLLFVRELLSVKEMIEKENYY